MHASFFNKYKKEIGIQDQELVSNGGIISCFNKIIHSTHRHDQSEKSKRIMCHCLQGLGSFISSVQDKQSFDMSVNMVKDLSVVIIDLLQRSFLISIRSILNKEQWTKIVSTITDKALGFVMDRCSLNRNTALLSTILQGHFIIERTSFHTSLDMIDQLFSINSKSNSHDLCCDILESLSDTIRSYHNAINNKDPTIIELDSLEILRLCVTITEMVRCYPFVSRGEWIDRLKLPMDTCMDIIKTSNMDSHHTQLACHGIQSLYIHHQNGNDKALSDFLKTTLDCFESIPQAIQSSHEFNLHMTMRWSIIHVCIDIFIRRASHPELFFTTWRDLNKLLLTHSNIVRNSNMDPTSPQSTSNRLDFIERVNLLMSQVVNDPLIRSSIESLDQSKVLTPLDHAHHPSHHMPCNILWSIASLSHAVFTRCIRIFDNKMASKSINFPFICQLESFIRKVGWVVSTMQVEGFNLYLSLSFSPEHIDHDLNTSFHKAFSDFLLSFRSMIHERCIDNSTVVNADRLRLLDKFNIIEDLLIGWVGNYCRKSFQAIQKLQCSEVVHPPTACLLPYMVMLRNMLVPVGKNQSASQQSCDGEQELKRLKLEALTIQIIDEFICWLFNSQTLTAEELSKSLHFMWSAVFYNGNENDDNHQDTTGHVRFNQERMIEISHHFSRHSNLFLKKPSEICKENTSDCTDASSFFRIVMSSMHCVAVHGSHITSGFSDRSELPNQVNVAYVILHRIWRHDGILSSTADTNRALFATVLYELLDLRNRQVVERTELSEVDTIDYQVTMYRLQILLVLLTQDQKADVHQQLTFNSYQTGVVEYLDISMASLNCIMEIGFKSNGLTKLSSWNCLILFTDSVTLYRVLQLHGKCSEQFRLLESLHKLWDEIAWSDHSIKVKMACRSALSDLSMLTSFDVLLDGIMTTSDIDLLRLNHRFHQQFNQGLRSSPSHESAQMKVFHNQMDAIYCTECMVHRFLITSLKLLEESKMQSLIILHDTAVRDSIVLHDGIEEIKEFHASNIHTFTEWDVELSKGSAFKGSVSASNITSEAEFQQYFNQIIQSLSHSHAVGATVHKSLPFNLYESSFISCHLSSKLITNPLLSWMHTIASKVFYEAFYNFTAALTHSKSSYQLLHSESKSSIKVTTFQSSLTHAWLQIEIFTALFSIYEVLGLWDKSQRYMALALSQATQWSTSTVQLINFLMLRPLYRSNSNKFITSLTELSTDFQLTSILDVGMKGIKQTDRSICLLAQILKLLLSKSEQPLQSITHQINSSRYVELIRDTGKIYMVGLFRGQMNCWDLVNLRNLSILNQVSASSLSNRGLDSPTHNENPTFSMNPEDADEFQSSVATNASERPRSPFNERNVRKNLFDDSQTISLRSHGLSETESLPRCEEQRSDVVALPFALRSFSTLMTSVKVQQRLGIYHTPMNPSVRIVLTALNKILTSLLSPQIEDQSKANLGVFHGLIKQLRSTQESVSQSFDFLSDTRKYLCLGRLLKRSLTQIPTNSTNAKNRKDKNKKQEISFLAHSFSHDMDDNVGKEDKKHRKIRTDSYFDQCLTFLMGAASIDTSTQCQCLNDLLPHHSTDNKNSDGALTLQAHESIMKWTNMLSNLLMDNDPSRLKSFQIVCRRLDSVIDYISSVSIPKTSKATLLDSSTIRKSKRSAICTVATDPTHKLLILGRYDGDGVPLVMSIPNSENMQRQLTDWVEIIHECEELLHSTQKMANVSSWGDKEKSSWWKSRESSNSKISDWLTQWEQSLGVFGKLMIVGQRCNQSPVEFTSSVQESVGMSNLQDDWKRNQHWIEFIVQNVSFEVDNPRRLLSWEEGMQAIRVIASKLGNEVDDVKIVNLMKCCRREMDGRDSLRDSWTETLQGMENMNVESHSNEECQLTRQDLMQYKVVELKKMAKELGLSISGKKEDMVNKILLHYEGESHSGPNLVKDSNDGLKQKKNHLHPVIASTSDEGSSFLDHAPSVVLLLDSHLQNIPWESLPCLCNTSCSRMYNLPMLLASLDHRQGILDEQLDSMGRDKLPNKKVGEIDLNNIWYAVDVDGNLPNTRNILQPVLEEFTEKFHWKLPGLSGSLADNHIIRNCLEESELFIFCGHNAGDSLFDHKNLHELNSCPSSLLWGCSSVRYRECGIHRGSNVPLSYLLNGAGFVVGNLWDVTDKDLDNRSVDCMQKFFIGKQDTPTSSDDNDSHHSVKNVNKKVLNMESSLSGLDINTAVRQSKKICKLEYAVGSAGVVYGLPMVCVQK